MCVMVVNLPVGEHLLLSQEQLLELIFALVSQVSHLSLALRPRGGHLFTRDS